jgi:hypothetical protein
VAESTESATSYTEPTRSGESGLDREIERAAVEQEGARQAPALTTPALLRWAPSHRSNEHLHRARCESLAAAHQLTPYSPRAGPTAGVGRQGRHDASLLTARTRSQAIQEPEECVWRAVAAGFAVQWLGAGECSFFEREVGVDVHLRGFDLFVSEPERDDGGVDPGVQ